MSGPPSAEGASAASWSQRWSPGHWMSGYRRLILDSHVSMTKAHAIYTDAGFRTVSAPADFPEALEAGRRVHGAGPRSDPGPEPRQEPASNPKTPASAIAADRSGLGLTWALRSCRSAFSSRACDSASSSIDRKGARRVSRGSRGSDRLQP